MLRTITAVLLLAFGTSAYAEGFDYDYFDLGYGRMDIDGINLDGDGFSLGGSVTITDNVHAFASYMSADFDFGVDATAYSIGVGYNTPMSDTIDFVGRVSYEKAEVSAGVIGADEDGFGVSAGLRFAASEDLEFNASLAYVDLGSGSGETAIGIGFLYDLSDKIAFGLNGSWGDDVSVYGIGGRFYFGR